jgi:hypothetical protein
LEEILTGISNTIGIYIKTSEVTRQRRYNAYARICVYLNISKRLLRSITLDYQDDEWSQTLDYENISLNNPTKPSLEDPDKTKEGFTQVIGRHRHPAKKPHPRPPQDPQPRIPSKPFKPRQIPPTLQPSL